MPSAFSIRIFVPTMICLLSLPSLSTSDILRYKPQLVYLKHRLGPVLDQRWETSLIGLGRLDSKYVGENGAGIAIAYHLRHNIALQASGSWLFWRTQTSLAQKLSKPPIDAYFRNLWFALLEMQIAPIYGQLSVSGQKPGYFQIFGSIGMGVSGVEFADPLQSIFPRTISLLGSFGFGVQLLFNEHFGISLELKDLVQARRPDGYMTAGQISHSWMGQAGVRYVF